MEHIENEFEASDRLHESMLLSMKTSPESVPSIQKDSGAAAIPTTATEALDMGNGWPESMVEEFMTLIEMGTFTYHKKSEVAPGEKILKNKWIFKDKGDRKKTRLVAAGYLQQFGTDYFESYSAVVASESFRVGIALNAYTGHDLIKYDAKNAYVMSDLSLEEQQWMFQPDHLEVKHDDDAIAVLLKAIGVEIPTCEEGDELILRLRKSLYGLVAAGRLFNKYVVAWALRIGFMQLRTDECIFIFDKEVKLSDGTTQRFTIILFIYVDDCMMDPSSKEAAKWFDTQWKLTFKSSANSGGIADFILGIRIRRNRALKTITLTQTHYIEDLARIYGQDTGRDYETPMATTFDPTYEPELPHIDLVKFPYRRIMGKLLFTPTRPDVACSVNELTRHMEHPQSKHWDAALRIVRYLYVTKEMGLTYCGALPSYVQNKVLGHSDATWASDKETSKSRAGWVIKLNGASVMWGSRMIHTVCMSSAESETSAAVMCTKDMLNMRLLLWELGYEQIGSSPISADNQATVKSASGNAQSKQSKYYQMRALFLRHYVRLGKIHFGYIPGAERIAD